jgi:SSS family solute:Na+ symporter
LVSGLPPFLGMVALAAVFSAELSSADAGMFMLSTSLSKDIFKRFLRPDATDAQVLRIARWGALLGGVLSVWMAITLPTVIAGLTIFYSLLSVSLFVPVVAGLYTRRTGSVEALAAIGAGLSALAAVQLLGPATPRPFLDRTSVGLIASGVTFLLVALVRSSRSQQKGEGV